MAATIRVLYVDDEPSLLDIGKLFLEESGDFNIATAMSAPEGIRLLEQEKFDAIISDYQMPGMDGIQFLVEVRKRFGQIPFILFTGRGREEVVIQAINCGADRYLQKGGDPKSQFAELAHNVNSAISRKKADAALRESEDTFKTLFESAGTAIFTMDHTLFLDCNKKTLKIFRCTRDQIIGHSPAEFSPERQPDGHLSAEKMKVKIDSAFLGEEQFFDWVHSRHDGILFNANVTLNRVLVRGTYSLQAIVKDITERKRAEEELIRKNEELAASGEELKSQFDALAESERTTRFLVEQLVMSQEIGHNGSWLYDPVTDTTWGSAEAHRLFGFPPVAGDFPMAEKESCIPERERVHQVLVDLISAGMEYNLEYVIHPVDGSAPKVIHSIARLEKDSQGTPIRVVGVFKDVTDRKRAEEALQAERNRIQMYLDIAGMMLFVLDWEGTVMLINRKGCKILGYSQEEILGRNWFASFLPEDLKVEVKGIFNKIINGDLSAVEYYENPVVTKSGDLRTIAFHNTVLTGPSGITGILFSGEDITERKRVEEALRLANKKMNLLSGITRHDLKNQLLSLNRYLGISKKYIDDAAKMSEFITKEEKIAKTMERQIAFTKEYEKVGVKAPVWQDCHTLADTASKQAPLGTVKVKNDLPAGADVFADPLVVKVFYNLMDNAVRYGGKITTIRFSVEEAGDDHLIVCDDDGDGVPAEEKEKIFERGFGKNTGIGLALSREILDITGITIREAGKPGQGARFEMTVPIGAYRFPEMK